MNGQSGLHNFLKRLTARSVLSDREKRSILQLPNRVAQLQPNQDFVDLGEKVDWACYVVEGLVGRFDQNSSGDRQITALHIPGDMPNLHSVIQPTATSALQALSQCMILEIPHSALRVLTTRHPAIAEAFWRDTMVDAMIVAQWVVNVGRRNAQSRIAHLLCEMACRYNAPFVGRSVEFVLPMTQVHLADALGLTPVHVSRTLKSLAEHGITMKHHIVRIGAWETLVEIGDFDRDYLQDGIRSGKQ